MGARTLARAVARARDGVRARAVRRSTVARARARVAEAPARDAAAESEASTSDMSVQEYIEKHDLTRKVEEALNAAVKAKAEEPLAFVVRRGGVACAPDERAGAARGGERGIERASATRDRTREDGGKWNGNVTARWMGERARWGVASGAIGVDGSISTYLGYSPKRSAGGGGWSGRVGVERVDAAARESADGKVDGA